MLTRPALLLSLCLLLALSVSITPRPPHPAALPPPPPLRALLVGGGPDREYNQVAIESNVRYVQRLLPPGTHSRTLYADGNPHSRIVLYTDAQGHDRYRVTTLRHVDGPARLRPFQQTFHSLTQNAPGPLLLYFTGHGSPGARGYDNNDYDLWGNDALSVTKLAETLSVLPPQTSVTVIMVQCFSGAFGSLLFAGGDPQGAPINLDLCGFFASMADSEAAGCTSEVDEADYHDFTSYFFAALSGQSRLGRRVSGADYNGDGTVGMNEAFAYALIHDPSIDTPVCTSDVFLRRFVPVASDRDIFQTAYTDVLGWADPAQRAALTALSTQLHLAGDDRLACAYTHFRHADRDGTDAQQEQEAHWTRFVRLAKSVVLAHRLQASGSAALQARYAALLAAEARSPLRLAP